MSKEIKVVELVIENEKDGVYAMSLVSKPAIMENFVFLSEQFEIKMAESLVDKNILYGAALVPNLKILRKDENNNPYYIFLSEETIRKVSQLFFINGNQSNATVQHLHKVEGVTIVEAWMVEDENNDKSNIYNLGLPKGAWVIGQKIDNPDVREQIKNGTLKGFSIEGRFSEKTELSAEEVILNEILEILTK